MVSETLATLTGKTNTSLTHEIHSLNRNTYFYGYTSVFSGLVYGESNTPVCVCVPVKVISMLNYASCTKPGEWNYDSSHSELWSASCCTHRAGLHTVQRKKISDHVTNHNLMHDPSRSRQSTSEQNTEVCIQIGDNQTKNNTKKRKL
jgi:hypothetical protein